MLWPRPKLASALPRRLTMLCVLVLIGTTSAFGQRGPVLPTRQDFPDPSNVQKRVPLPNEKGADSLGEPGEFGSEEVFKPPVAPPQDDDGSVFQPPSPPLEEPAIERPLDFGTPVPRLPAPSLPNRTLGGNVSFNVGIALTERLLNQLASDVRQQADAVCDRILGTPVSGTQTTNATTRVDCRPNPNIAQVDIVLESLTNTNTLGQRSNVAISTEGFHRADLVKPVFFDGQILRTRRPQGFVRSNNMNRGVVTPLTGVPLLGPIANRFAFSQAELSRRAGETETAASLSRRVVPEFNQSVDSQLAEANAMMRNQVQAFARQLDLWPDELRANSTDDEVRLRARYGNASPVTGPSRRLFGQLGSVLLHESAVNNVVSRLQVGGLRITDRQLQTSMASLKAGEPISLEAGPDGEDPTAPALYTLVFADTDPVRVRFDEEQSEVVLRMSIEPIVGGALPMQEVHLPLLVSVVGENLELTFGTPGVVPADGTEPGMPSQLIGEQIAKMLQTVSVPNKRELVLSPQKRVTARVSSVAASNGWFLMAVD